MQSYLLKRLSVIPFVIFAVTVLTFSLMHFMPGDPAQLIARSRFGEQVTEQEVRRIRDQESLDRSVMIQYLRWIGRVGRGDMGRSIETGRPVSREILSRWPHTLVLAVISLFFSLLIGIPLGAYCGSRKGRLPDEVGTTAGIIGVSVPNFWLALLLICFFDIYLGWFPAHSSHGFRSVVLPAMTLGVSMAALTLRITRARMANVMHQEYIRHVRARGVGEWSAVGRHALKNTLIPVITVLGLQFGRLLEGAVIVETIFGRPGIGRLLVRSIFARDFPVVQGCVITIALVFLSVNLLMDVIYTWLDPRIHYQGGKRHA